MAVATFTADGLRQVTAAATFTSETNRAIYATNVGFTVDTLRRFKTAMTGIKSVSITHAAKTISDTFNAETVNQLDLGVAVTGSLFDINYEFYVQETSQTGDVQQIAGMYDVDEMLSKPILYAAADTAYASSHIDLIAAHIGKTAVINIDDFIPSTNISAGYPVYRDAIGTLFGWTDRLPQRQINVFLRGDVMHVLQRGKETGTQTIVEYTRPTIRKKKMRTITYTQDPNDKDEVGYNVSPMPFSGTIAFGDSSCTYVAGYLMTETHPVDGGVETTTYGYASGYVVSRTTESEKIRKTTEYDYGGYRGDELSTITETTYDLQNPSAEPTVQITRYHPIGAGFWAQVVEVDGETISTTMARGKPGGKASIFAVDQSNRSLGGGYTAPDDPFDQKLPGRAIIDANFPVKGAAFLADLKTATLWLHGRTEERVTFDCYDTAVIDFTKTVTWNGNVYYLERNVLSQDPRGKKQAIEIVRWY